MGEKLADSKIYSYFHKYQGRLRGYGPNWENWMHSTAVGENPFQAVCGKG